MLSELQRALEVIYGVSAPLNVEDFLIGRAARDRLRGPGGASEELLVVPLEGEVQVGLYLSEEIVDGLPSLCAPGASAFLEQHLPAFSTAAEGVSHFVYLTLQALRDRAVSLLELEAQAEIDKFATCLLHLWKHGERRRSPELRARLFDRVGYRSGLSGDERARYGFANALARGYAAFLESRFVLDGCLQGLLAELRHSYRLAAADKYAYLVQRG
jgi:hypothetical protein